ncbi:MAG: hypothetical protein CSA52_00815 [Gammaproteobacteria bacterium]|nr:MAG: hypothetical protein CSB48_08240 [Pseudomonadota bacterium]PIE38844.1 MAG: hypothetical protein CSA52_00815 [Gammaproteobacteria bacterium]
MNSEQTGSSDHQNKPPFPANYLIATAFATVLATVFALEIMGKIKHNADHNAFEVGEYKGILLTPGQEHRLSTKPAVIAAECINGHVVFTSLAKKNDMKALITDYKNRPVLCAGLDP